MGWLLLQALRTGWWSGEKFVLFLAYIYLLGARLFAELTHVGPTPFICAALLCVLARRIAPDMWLHLKQIVVSKADWFSRRQPDAAPVATRDNGGVQA